MEEATVWFIPAVKGLIDVRVASRLIDLVFSEVDIMGLYFASSEVKIHRKRKTLMMVMMKEIKIQIQIKNLPRLKTLPQTLAVVARVVALPVIAVAIVAVVQVVAALPQMMIAHQTVPVMGEENIVSGGKRLVCSKIKIYWVW